VVIETNNRCVKMLLPNLRVVDILTPVFDELKKWLQDSNEKPESGGYIVGYQHKRTGNISLEKVSHPYLMDVKNRVRFDIRDLRHKLFLKKVKRHKSYYMGVWHTHPQCVPIPSSIDWNDWYETMQMDKTGCEYVFFLIVGTDVIRAWVGDFQTRKITEIIECEKNSNGIYIDDIQGNSKDDEENI